MKKALYPFLTAFTCLFGSGDEPPRTVYAEIQAMGGYPLVGVAVRSQTETYGWDLSFCACPFNPPHSLATFHGKALYLMYPARGGLYLGGGGGVLGEWEMLGGIFPCIEGAIGFQWKNRFIFSLDALIPLHPISLHKLPVWPGLTIGVGF